MISPPPKSSSSFSLGARYPVETSYTPANGHTPLTLFGPPGLANYFVITILMFTSTVLASWKNPKGILVTPISSMNPRTIHCLHVNKIEEGARAKMLLRLAHTHEGRMNELCCGSFLDHSPEWMMTPGEFRCSMIKGTKCTIPSRQSLESIINFP